MTPTKLLIGDTAVVFAIVIAGVWCATQWAAAMLGYQAQLGSPTRSGKGVGLVIPTLLGWTGSTVVHDIKGENWRLTAGWRSRFSHCLLSMTAFEPPAALLRTTPGSLVKSREQCSSIVWCAAARRG